MSFISVGDFAGLVPLIRRMVVRQVGIVMSPPQRLVLKLASTEQLPYLATAALHCPLPQGVLRIRLIEV